ncbi:alpha/beta hydrolase [Dyella humicola]|uniref:alpha/beta hydrolase n=1 Tax=Dyella humicola TaxID=2992126 RepID=UPI0022547F20|nr:alpha/beta hydrolase [Dyella humicola]
MGANDPTVVFVHGAWVNETSWDKVVHALRSKGIATVVVTLPLSSLRDDTVVLGDAIEQIDGPIVLVGHAYAGAVIASMEDRKVKALIHIAALAPDEGETVADVFHRFGHGRKAPKLVPDASGWIRLPAEAFGSAFAPNATPEEQKYLAENQLPISPTCITVPVGSPLWKRVPSWYLVAEMDHMIPVETQRFMAERMKAHTMSCAADHLPSVTAPGCVEEIVVTALSHLRQ